MVCPEVKAAQAGGALPYSSHSGMVRFVGIGLGRNAIGQTSQIMEIPNRVRLCQIYRTAHVQFHSQVSMVPSFVSREKEHRQAVFKT